MVFGMRDCEWVGGSLGWGLWEGIFGFGV